MKTEFEPTFFHFIFRFFGLKNWGSGGGSGTGGNGGGD